MSRPLTEEQVVCALGCVANGRNAGHISTENAKVVREFIRGAAAPAPGPRVYISGPITGMPEENKPAFAAEAARLLALGYQVENPADVVLPDGATWADFMRADIPRLLACTHIRMLDGWTMSKGARLEHHIAISLGLEVLTDCDLLEQK